ncbi:hypothetical protein QR680_004883 [Steinernema hermaphroditum]|uniref:RING-type domain-containing protein n=1 Tax=Steinernema hermaphroditum TaxID=289476 RepID=A0AA39HQ45_9BILA|nr:hypothetical protein QR680_004883 [Steinernema hermaphroditum]
MEEIKARHERTLNCPICFNVFVEPVQMTCGHTYCRECLKTLINHHKKRDFRGNQLIDCALCRAPSRVQDISMNVNYVVKEATDIYKQMLAMKSIKCTECGSNMDTTSRFFYCDTCRFQSPNQQDEISNLICGACGLVSHKAHDVKELQKATEEDKRKRRAKINNEVEWTRRKLSDLDESMDSFVAKMRRVRDSIQGSLLKHEAIGARFQEPVMFQKTLDEMATESKDHSTTNCRWIRAFLKQMKEMERRIPQAPPAANDADVVTISDDETQEVDHEEVEDESSRESFANSSQSSFAEPKLEADGDSLSALLMDSAPTISSDGFPHSIALNVLGGSSFQTYAPTPQSFPYHSYEPPPHQQAFLPYVYPKPLPGYPRSQFVPSAGYAQLPHHP